MICRTVNDILCIKREGLVLPLHTINMALGFLPLLAFLLAGKVQTFASAMNAVASLFAPFFPKIHTKGDGISVIAAIGALFTLHMIIRCTFALSKQLPVHLYVNSDGESFAVLQCSEKADMRNNRRSCAIDFTRWRRLLLASIMHTTMVSIL